MPIYCKEPNCISEKTGKRTIAIYGFSGEGAKYCSKHKLEGMVNVKDKTCIFENCKTIPYFNYPNENIGLYCSKHQKPGMKNVKSKTCAFEGCTTMPSFNYEKEKKALYCVTHKLEGMINVISKTCAFESCEIQPSFNYSTKKVGLYCVEHKLEGMKNVIDKLCVFEGCEIQPVFNYPNEKVPLYCVTHKLEGMTNIKSKICKTKFCETQIRDNYKYKGYCSRCYRFMFPDEPISINYKTKENEVFKFISENFSNYNWISDKTIYGGCSRRRPDIFLDLFSHVIVIETDENQHTDYGSTCENKRLMELSEDIGHRPMIMIRFNPDGYTDFNGKKVQSCWFINKNNGECEIRYMDKWLERLDILGKEVEKWIEIGCDLDKIVEVVSLFYDENTKQTKIIENSISDEKNYTKQDLEKHTIKELILMCKEKGIRGYSHKKKVVIIQMILC